MIKIIPLLVNSAVSFFFLSLLLFKGAYNIAPFFLVALALVSWIYLFTKKQKIIFDKNDKFLICSYIFYFFVFLLSILVNGGKLKELDFPSRLLLFIPLLSLFGQYPLFFRLFSYVIPFSALIAGCVAMYDRFILNMDAAYANRMLQIQAGDIAMSLGIFSLVMAFYFVSKKEKKITALCLMGMLFGLLGSFLSTARGGWIGLPILVVCVLFLYRHSLSKKFLLLFSSFSVILMIIAGSLPQTQISERIQLAYQEVQSYFQDGNGETSVGARLDMWKSAVLMAKEKPLLGHGKEGMMLAKHKQVEQKIISSHVAQFTHVHNQFLDDLAKRGVIGLIALLLVFFVPLRHFILHLNPQHLIQHSIAVLGITHVVATMCYCLTQGFLAHNSGTIFYFFLVVVFYAMLKFTKYDLVK